MITTIIFDLSEVYLYGMYQFERHLAPKLNLTREDSKRIFDIPELKEFFNGRLTEEEYFIKAIEKSKIDVSVDLLKKAVRKNFQEIEGTREIIEKLSKNGYKLGLLSVHTREWIDHCEKKFNYHKLFHSVMYSFEVQVCKPDKLAYQHILKKLDSKPQECIFIDDYDKNIESAKELGINVILFKNPNQLKSELRKFSIILD
jgi:epoxide hydrolase-like predicted phosphatase